MSPHEIIERLSKRYGVPQEFGRRMLPLLERAQVVEPAARKRILDLVERSYAHEAEIQAREKAKGKLRLAPNERKLVTALAESLHDWDIPSWLDPAPRERPGGSPDERQAE